MDIRYYGWSGLTVRHANTLVGFDLFGAAVKWRTLDTAQTTILCLTHGHPEHCGSLRSLLLADDGRSRLPTTYLVSSASVADYVARGGALPSDNVYGVGANETVSISGTRVSAFAWKHMPLLPSGIQPKVEYIAHVLSHPIELMRIGLSSLSLPMNAPMLGFHITFADGCTVLNYAEGLHRLTERREVEQVAQYLPADTLLFAVEPEDVDVIPHWVEILHPSTVYLYEAHRPWRELFRLPYVDLSDYSQRLSNRFKQTQFRALLLPGN